jgi:hypothetical protein
MLSVVEDELTRSIWISWQDPKMTWLEVRNLAGYFVKQCKENNLDYKAIDIKSALDSKLDYSENLQIIDDLLGVKQPDYGVTREQIETEQDQATKIFFENEKLKRKMHILTEELNEIKNKPSIPANPINPLKDLNLLFEEVQQELELNREIIAYLTNRKIETEKHSYELKRKTSKFLKAAWRIIY